MKRLIIGAVTAFALSSSAYAADIHSRGVVSYKDAPMAHHSITWTGFYIGANVGGLFANTSAGNLVDDVTGGAVLPAGPLSAIFEPDDFMIKDRELDNQFIAGLHVGYNWQDHASNLVLGVEGDLSFGEDIDYLATLRARIGLASDNALFYVTGGVAFAKFDQFGLGVMVSGNTSSEQQLLGLPVNPGVRSAQVALPIGSSDSETGWVIGGGAEFKVAPHWSFGVEGLYYKFDDVDSRVDFKSLAAVPGVPAGTVINTFERDYDVNFWTVRARLTYHLDSDQAPLK